MRVRGPRGVTTWRRRYALVPLLLAAVGVPALLWAPAEDEVAIALGFRQGGAAR